jgi:hypothetical protein
MAKVRVVLDHKAMARLLKSSEVRGDIKRRVDAIAASAGEGYVAEVEDQKNRVRGAVYTHGFEAILDQARHHTLERALGAGRG